MKVVRAKNRVVVTKLAELRVSNYVSQQFDDGLENANILLV